MRWAVLFVPAATALSVRVFARVREGFGKIVAENRVEPATTSPALLCGFRVGLRTH